MKHYAHIIICVGRGGYIFKLTMHSYNSLFTSVETDNASNDTDDSKPSRRRRSRSARSSPANLPDEKVAAATSVAAATKASRAPPTASTTTVTASSHGHDEEGCLVCHKDDNHAYLLLCEACNDEYHTYCLNPPLETVPEGDFFCGKLTDEQLHCLILFSREVEY